MGSQQTSMKWTKFTLSWSDVQRMSEPTHQAIDFRILPVGVVGTQRLNEWLKWINLRQNILVVITVGSRPNGLRIEETIEVGRTPRSDSRLWLSERKEERILAEAFGWNNCQTLSKCHQLTIYETLAASEWASLLFERRLKILSFWETVLH